MKDDNIVHTVQHVLTNKHVKIQTVLWQVYLARSIVHEICPQAACISKRSMLSGL